MTVEFGQNNGSVPVAEVEVKSPAVVTIDATTGTGVPQEVPARITSVVVPATSNRMTLGDSLPGFKDVILPRLNLVQSIGQLKDSFPQGAIVFNQAVTLFTPPIINAKTGNVEQVALPPVILTVLGIVSSRFSEKITGGTGGQIVNTEDEVRAAGGTLDYKEYELKKTAGMRRFEPLIDLLITIKRPEHVADDDTVFVYEVEGAKYALGLWSVKGTAYTAAMKRVFNFHRLAGCLRGGYSTHNFAMTTRLEKYPGGNSAWVPICVPNKKSTPEFMTFVRQIIEAPAVTE
jgi:hypothetical protein